MQMHLDSDPGTFGIYAYRPGAVTVGIPIAAQDIHTTPPPPRREVLTRSLVIMPGRLIDDWPPQCFEDLIPDHFAPLTAHDLEIVLFGSGSRLRWPAPSMLAMLLERGVGVEVMDTGAACRTYNILRADGRRVAAALLID